jgi:regulatory protein
MPTRSSSTTPADPYLLGLRWLARRELSAAALSARLRARGFADEAIGAALERLCREGALDDRRTALAAARTEAEVKGRGRIRALATLARLGIGPEVARAAVAEVYAALDERALIERALARRRLDRLDTAAARRRAYTYLLRQGFSPELIRTVLRTRRRAEDALP